MDSSTYLNTASKCAKMINVIKTRRYDHLTLMDGESEMNITTLGIDLAKAVFQLHGGDINGKTMLKRTLTCNKLLPFIANLPKCRIVMEARGGENFWARKFTSYGHDVKLISPQFVKPFVKSNRNDYCDARGDC